MSTLAIRACPACRATETILGGKINEIQLGRCPRCLAQFALEVPSPERIAEMYRKVYENNDLYQMNLDELDRLKQSGVPQIGRYRKKTFMDRCQPAPGDKLLEVGCGIGSFLMAAHRRGWQVEGIDASEEALAISKATHKLPVHLGQFENMSFESKPFKAVVCWEVLEHLVSPADFLTWVKKILRADGVLACSVPNESSKVPFPPTRGPASIPPIHLNFWDSKSFRRFFELNGFRVLHLAPKRSMFDKIDYKKRPLNFFLNQIGALLGIREGGNIFALVTSGGCDCENDNSSEGAQRSQG